MEAARQPELLAVHPEIERIERMGRLCDTLTHDRFKDALTMCSFNMLETGKVNAFAIYETVDGIDISDPVLSEPKYRCRFGEDSTECVWREETKIDELLQDDSPKKQQLLCTIDKISCAPVPRKDVWACVMGFPMGGMDGQGLKAKDLQRPTKAYLDFYLQQELLHPGFIGGILTNDGEKSGLLLFKKSENVEKVNTSMWGYIGTEDGIGRDQALTSMQMSGMVYADIDLTCPKKREKETDEKYQQRITNKYGQRVSKAVGAIFD
jgi:hypothetical protein